MKDESRVDGFRGVPVYAEKGRHPQQGEVSKARVFVIYRYNIQRIYLRILWFLGLVLGGGRGSVNRR